MNQKKYLSADNSAPGIGGLVTAYLKKRRIATSAVARAINRSYPGIVKIKKQHSMQTSILWELSQVLKHNFFADIAALLPETFTTDVPADTGKDELIASLQQQLNDAAKERDVLMKTFGGGRS